MSSIPDNVIVDDEDRAFLESFGKWRIGSQGYCVRTKWDPIMKTKKEISMHRVVLEKKLGRPIAPGLFCDHINGIRTDCSKLNLREVTRQQNQQNMTRAKGYSWDKRVGKWRAQIGTNGILICLGYFDTETEARDKYLEAKAIYHKIP